MNREEYEIRKARLEDEYIEKLLALEKEWLKSRPREILEPDTFSSKFNPTERARIVIDDMKGEFTIADAQKRHAELFPNISPAAPQTYGRLLGSMVFEKEMEVIRYGSGSNPGVWRRGLEGGGG